MGSRDRVPPKMAAPPTKKNGSEDEGEGLLEEGTSSPSPLPPQRRTSHANWLFPVLGGVLIAAYLYSQMSAPVSSRRLPPQEPIGVILSKAGRRALGGGLSGAAAGVCQVLLLMWLRTTMNYQYRYGGSTRETFRVLYAEGGVRRFYQGLPWALLQTPLTRFGDTAANSGVLLLLASTHFGQALPLGMRTAVASVAAALWRIVLTPIDTLKTTMQVQGPAGYKLLMAKVGTSGVSVLWSGAMANFAANFVGNYPWYASTAASAATARSSFTTTSLPPLPPPLRYLTLNTLEGYWAAPLPEAGLLPKLLRHAVTGFCATCVSDCTSNSIRVIKTTRQTSEVSITYAEAVQQVLRQDGWAGLFGRGLGVRLATNGIQASLFTVIWKLGEEYLATKGLG
jgi:hypothetical protein